MTLEPVENMIESMDATGRCDRPKAPEVEATSTNMKVPKMCSETDLIWAKSAWHDCLQNCLYGLATFFALLGDEMEG